MKQYPPRLKVVPRSIDQCTYMPIVKTWEGNWPEKANKPIDYISREEHDDIVAELKRQLAEAKSSSKLQ